MPQQVCFMVMPFGKKPTGSTRVDIPKEIDFDRLWDAALSPVIRELGYLPVRADQDVGGSIVKEMIERLTLADVVVADVTLPNANVYYEIGVRQAAKERGCVLVAADWAEPVFDIAQMRQLRFPLQEGSVTDDTARAIREALIDGIAALRDGRSPVYEHVEGYPDALDPARSEAFADLVKELSEFQSRVTAVREAPPSRRAKMAEELVADYPSGETMSPAVAVELLFLLRDATDWEQTVDFIDALPSSIAELPVVKEQRALAAGQGSGHLEAIGQLSELIKQHGDSPERRGLLGGRYKRLWDSSDVEESESRRYLTKAIENYNKGMYLDLNEYYCSSNLSRLFRARNRSGDGDKAQLAAGVTLAACTRARQLGTGDEWLHPTLLGAAFDAGDVTAAEELRDAVMDEGAARWKLESTLDDLETSLGHATDPEVAEGLGEVLDELRGLV
jgi:hypothetical protein